MNDNLEGFLPIRFHVHLILNRLRNERALRELTEDKKIGSDKDSKPAKENQSDTEEKRKYIEHRLREISAWETRINGGRKA